MSAIVTGLGLGLLILLTLAGREIGALSTATQLSIFLFVFVPLFLYLITLVLAQRVANRVVRQLLFSKPVDDGAAVLLFLRSFRVARQTLLDRLLDWLAQIRAVLMLVAGPSSKNFDSLMGLAEFNVEERIDDAAGDGTLFVAIGNKEVSFGAGKLVVADDEWEGVLDRLASRAGVIFLLPGTSESVIFELDRMMQSADFAAKLVMIMPRELAETDNRARMWSRVRDAVSRRTNVVLPDYDESGSAFRYLSDGSIEHISLDAMVGRISAAIDSGEVVGPRHIWRAPVQESP